MLLQSMYMIFLYQYNISINYKSIHVLTIQHFCQDDPNLSGAEKRYDRVRKWTKKVYSMARMSCPIFIVYLLCTNRQDSLGTSKWAWGDQNVQNNEKNKPRGFNILSSKFVLSFPIYVKYRVIPPKIILNEG